MENYSVIYLKKKLYYLTVINTYLFSLKWIIRRGKNHSLSILIICSPILSLFPLFPSLTFLPELLHTPLYTPSTRQYSLSTLYIINYIYIIGFFPLGCVTVRNICCPSRDANLHPRPRGIKCGHMTYSHRVYSGHQS